MAKKIEYSFGDTILKASNISLVLDGRQILRDINLEVKDVLVPGRVTGQVLGLLGPSGRGKTQLFKILAGLNKPTTGEVLIGDIEKGLARPVRAGDVGVVAQSYPLFEHRTIWSNLMMVFHKNETPAQMKERVEFYLDRFGLLEHKDKYPMQLSGGQRQRIAIIQQILCSEHYILMDEPFSGLDPNMTREVCSMIQEIADLDEMNTIIVISHDITSTLAISDIVWLLGNDYEKDDAGNYKRDKLGKQIPIPGARIKYQQNLMDMGLTWDPQIANTPDPDFSKLVGEVRNLYQDL
jgi:ABC-type nitrate/sulfonate/bicarbonate transport system ATPase subunit